MVLQFEERLINYLKRWTCYSNCKCCITLFIKTSSAIIEPAAKTHVIWKQNSKTCNLANVDGYWNEWDLHILDRMWRSPGLYDRLCFVYSFAIKQQEECMEYYVTINHSWLIRGDTFIFLFFILYSPHSCYFRFFIWNPLYVNKFSRKDVFNRSEFLQ